MIARVANLSRNRPGMASVAALVVLLVVGLICGVLLKIALARRVEVGREERLLQAAWLAESGLDRAASRLGSSADYAGETWSITAEELGGRGSATVAIAVEKVADQPDRRKVRVQADYPADSRLRARQSREIVVTLPKSPRSNP